MTLNKIKSRASGTFSAILVFCPDWPPLAQTSTAKKFQQLIGFIDAILAETKNEQARQWLSVCLQEVNQSWKAYEAENLSEGRRLIQRAEEHFKNGVSKKQLKARFIADQSGSSLDNEPGS